MARKTPVEESIERLAEEKIYEKVYEEVASGTKREGLWFKALSESGGEETKAKALYVKLRVRSLIDELIVTEQIHQDEYKAQQDKYKEATRYNKKLTSSRKRAAVNDSAFRFISYIASSSCWIFAFFGFISIFEAEMEQVFFEVIITCSSGFLGYNIWPKKSK